MDWKEFISHAYQSSPEDDEWEDAERNPIFYPPASFADIRQLELAMHMELPQLLKELLLTTNGFGEVLVFADGREDISYGTVLLNTKEIEEYTSYFRSSGFDTNIEFKEMVFFATPGVDGIYFSVRKNEETIYAWYPMDRAFQPVSSNLSDFIFDWLSNALEY